MTARRWTLLALAGAAIVLLAARAAARVYVDYHWFDALGALDVWRARAGALIVLRVVAGAAAFFFVFANLYAVRHSVASVVFPRRVANLEIGEQVPGRYLMLAVVAISIAMAALLALMLDDWSTFLLARDGVPFGETDPYFIADLGFFVYWLPFEQQLYYWTLIGAMIVTALVVFFYALTPSLRWDRGRLYVSGYVRRHLTVLAGVVLLILAWSFRLDMYGLLTAGGGPDGAFGYVDHKVLVPGNLILAIATLGAALIVVFAGWTGQGRLASAAILGVVGLTLVTREIAPLVVERSGTPAEREAREQPYLKTRAGYTVRSFDVDDIRRSDTATSYATLADAAAAVSVWDGPAIARALESARRAEISGASLGWRASPRGIVADVPERPPRSGSDTTRAVFGLSRILGAAVDEHAGVVRLLADGGGDDYAQLAPATVFPGARGDLVVADTAGRIAAASVESDLSRYAHALAFQRLRWAMGELPRPHPTVVTHRDVRDRLHRLVPFLVQGTRITPVISGDSLFWTLDLYVASSSYPISQHLLVAGDDRTYFQHAATALVLAATGETHIVADSLAGPLAMSWMRRFHTLFTRWNAIPPAVRSALPPAYDALRAQALAFAHYGQRPDGEYMLPTLEGGDSALAGAQPVMIDPRSGAAMASQVVLDPTDRVRGAVVARGGAARATLWFPLAAPGPKWTTVLDRLDDADSAATSAAARDATLARGPVRVVPVGSTLVFVQPAYTWRAQGAPSLARVAVWLGDTVRVAPTLADLVGIPASDSLVVAATPSADLRARAASLYATMRDALRRGDWAAFGRAFDALGAALGAPAAAPRR